MKFLLKLNPSPNDFECVQITILALLITTFFQFKKKSNYVVFLKPR